MEECVLFFPPPFPFGLGSFVSWLGWVFGELVFLPFSAFFPFPLPLPFEGFGTFTPMDARASRNFVEFLTWCCFKISIIFLGSGLFGPDPSPLDFLVCLCHARSWQ